MRKLGLLLLLPSLVMASGTVTIDQGGGGTLSVIPSEYPSNPTFTIVTSDTESISYATIDHLLGTDTNRNLAVDDIGYIYISTGSAIVPIETDPPSQIATLELPAGDWDITAQVMTVDASINFGLMYICVTQTSGSCGGADIINGYNYNVGALSSQGGQAVIPKYRLSLSATTSIYLNCNIYHDPSSTVYYSLIATRRS